MQHFYVDSCYAASKVGSLGAVIIVELAMDLETPPLNLIILVSLVRNINNMKN